jgi:hypothetical protein
MPKVTPPCPGCGAAETIPVMYGYPSYQAFQQQEAGLIMLGGCLVDPDNPDWHCKVCCHEWQQPTKTPKQAEPTAGPKDN